MNDAWVEDKPGSGKFVTGASADIAYYPDRVGIGLNGFSQAHKLYVRGIKDTDITNTAVRVDAFYEGSRDKHLNLGLGAVSRNNGTGTIGYGIGTQGIIRTRMREDHLQML